MTETRDHGDGPGLSLEEARRAAQQHLDRTGWEVELVPGRSKETPEVWIFVSEARSGEPVFGNPVLVVDRQTGKVNMPCEGWRLFAEPEPTLWDRVRRWWRGGER